MTIRQLIRDPRGYLVALYLDGSLYRETRDPNASGFQTEWKPVDLGGIDGRVVQVTCNHDGILTVLLADGTAREDAPVGVGEYGKRKWRAVPLPC